jgi:hypothetical protein
MYSLLRALGDNLGDLQAYISTYNFEEDALVYTQTFSHTVPVIGEPGHPR